MRSLLSSFQSAGELKSLLSTLGFSVDIVQVTPGIMRGEIRASHHPEALAMEMGLDIIVEIIKTQIGSPIGLVAVSS